jgi:hypothetical protein
MFGRKKKKKEEPKEDETVDLDAPIKEGEATGIYRVTLEKLDENLKEKKKVRSSIDRLIKNSSFEQFNEALKFKRTV